MSETISLTQFVVAVASASFATFLGSFGVEWLKNRRENKKLKDEFKAQLSIELEQLIKLASRLKSEFKARRYFPLNVLELFVGSLLRIEERMKILTLLENNELQRQIFETIADCRVLAIEINASENWVIEKGIDQEEKERRYKEVKEQDRPEKNVELSDIQRRLEELVKSLKI